MQPLEKNYYYIVHIHKQPGAAKGFTVYRRNGKPFGKPDKLFDPRQFRFY